MIAAATARRPSSVAANNGTRRPSPSLTLVTGNLTPITPVERANVRSARVCSNAARALPTSAWSASPSTPVAAFAEPAVATIASAQPNLPPPVASVALRWARDMRIGAATTWLLVKTAATAAGASMVEMTPRSGRPEGLIPAARPPARKPPGMAARSSTPGRAIGSGARSAERGSSVMDCRGLGGIGCGSLDWEFC